MPLRRIGFFALVLAAACGSSPTVSADEPAPPPTGSVVGVTLDVTDVATGRVLAAVKSDAKTTRPAGAQGLSELFAPITILIASGKEDANGSAGGAGDASASPLRYVAEIDVTPPGSGPRRATIDIFEVRKDGDLRELFEAKTLASQLRACDRAPAACKDRDAIAQRLASVRAVQATRHASATALLSADGRAHEELTLPSPARKIRVDLALR